MKLLTVTAEPDGLRADTLLAGAVPDLTRSAAQRLLERWVRFTREL